MNELLLKQLLKIIHNKEDIAILVQKGYSFSQIAEEIVEGKQCGLLKIENGAYVLTTSGIESFKRMKPFREINSLDEYRIKNIALDEIYIPKL